MKRQLSTARRRRSLSIRLVAVVATLGLVLAACGNGDPDPEPEAAPEEPDAPEPEEDDAEEPAAVEGGFYDGAEITILVPFGPGGGSDVAARFFAPYLSDHLEGNPAIQVENVPGGAAITGTNEFYNLREPDGFTILITAVSNTLPYLLGSQAVEYDLSDLQPIVGVPGSIVVWGQEATGISSAADLNDATEPLIMAGRQPDGPDLTALLGLEVLGILDDVELVFGYSGGDETYVAFEQDEVNMGFTNPPGWLNNDERLYASGAVPLYGTGVIDASGNNVADPAAPDFPSIQEAHEMLHGEVPSGPAWDGSRAFTSILGTSTITLWVHGEVPAEAVAELRAALAEAMSDADALAGAMDTFGTDQLLLGDDLDQLQQAYRDLDPDALSWVQDFLSEEYGVEF